LEKVRTWREGPALNLSDVDAVVFDVDGVLVCVESSFPLVVVEVVGEYMRRKGARIEGSPMTFEDFLAFKRVGGFNSDWDLSLAAVLFFLAKRGLYGDDLRAWREASPSLEEFLQEVKEEGGGLEGATKVLRRRLGPDFAKVEREWDREGVIGLFKETYAGRFCERIYGFKGSRNDDGYISREKLLVDLSLLRGLKMPKGVVTGRTRGETEVCFELLGLNGLFPEWAVLTHDDGVRKPDPWGLLEMSSRLGASKPVYVGDTVDDLEMVRRARGRGLGAICALVLSGHGGEGNINFFREIGAEWVARDVNEVLRVIIEERRSTKGAEEREGPKGN